MISSECVADEGEQEEKMMMNSHIWKSDVRTRTVSIYEKLSRFSRNEQWNIVYFNSSKLLTTVNSNVDILFFYSNLKIVDGNLKHFSGGWILRWTLAK